MWDEGEMTEHRHPLERWNHWATQFVPIVLSVISLYLTPAVGEEPSPQLLPGDALEHLDALYRFARRLSSGEDEAQDLVQDTYARALGKRTQFVPGTNIKAWLLRIMRNLYVDGWRRAKISPVSDRLEDDVVEDAGASHEALRGDEELERLRGIVAEEIEDALRTLSVDARAIVLLDLEGLTEGELAEVLGCSPGTVKSRLSRARAKLRERLRDYSR